MQTTSKILTELVGWLRGRGGGGAEVEEVSRGRSKPYRRRER